MCPDVPLLVEVVVVPVEVGLVLVGRTVTLTVEI